MKLLVIRHAIAMDKLEYHEEALLAARRSSPVESRADQLPETNDDLRPLTSMGARKMRKNAKGLRSLMDIPDLLLSSPLVRARQTAEIVGEKWLGLEITFCEALRPGSEPSEFVSWCKARPELARAGLSVAIVGHEPHLSILISWLLAGTSKAFLELKKGGAALIEFERLPEKGRGRLLWLASPRWLRQF